MKADFDRFAEQALDAYNLGDAKISFLQHSENVTYHVQADQAYLLRLHTPLTPEMGTHGDDPAVIESEITWLDALKRARLPVQTGIRNRAGKTVTTLERDHSPLNASLLTWLDGVDYTREFESEETVRQIGNLIGRLHKHASHWRLPRKFTRPNRDMEAYRCTLDTLRPAVNDGRIAYSDFYQFETVLETLQENLVRLRKTRQTYGLLHGDLHKGNFIYHDPEIYIIDFSLGAFGPYLFDLAIALSDTREEFRPTLLQEYQNYMKLPLNWQVLVEGLYLASMIGTFSFWINSPEAQETLVRRVPFIAREYATRFNYNERFWFTEMFF